jgi:hypothetical protein
VVIQDPTWEQSFPDVASVAVPFADPCDEHVRLVRLSVREVRARRRGNEERLARLVDDLVAYGLEPVLIATSDPNDIDAAFLEWAELRRRSRWVR